MNADLHCHSKVSDGTLEPEALAARAKANGVELWPSTDHDELGGQRGPALRLAPWTCRTSPAPRSPSPSPT
jgi:predicted metal-dependent phosphoesterase TrpH